MNFILSTLLLFDSDHLPICANLWHLSQHVGKLLWVKIKQVPVRSQGGTASHFEWYLKEDTESPEQGCIGEGATLMWDFGVNDQGAFSPLGFLVCEAIAAIPSTGSTVASLLAVGVGIMITAILDVAWAENHYGIRCTDVKEEWEHFRLHSSLQNKVWNFVSRIQLLGPKLIPLVTDDFDDRDIRTGNKSVWLQNPMWPWTGASRG